MKPTPKDLIDLPLVIVRYQVGMLELHFGKVTKEGDKAWGDYIIHVSAAWRLLHNEIITVGDIDKTDWAEAFPQQRLTVLSVEVNSIGDLAIDFSENYRLQVFGSGTDDEFWRLLGSEEKEEHYVIGTSEYCEQGAAPNAPSATLQDRR